MIFDQIFILKQIISKLLYNDIIIIFTLFIQLDDVV